MVGAVEPSSNGRTHELHVVVGAGAVGTAVATLLADTGHRVRVVTRSGRGPQRPGVENVAADAADATRLVDHTAGATAIYNCANPPYHRWAQQWPPIAAALLEAAQRSGAVLATVSNLYGYGPLADTLATPMTEDLPLAATHTKGRVRAQMWADALAAHRAGRVRVTEVRGSDYVGPHTQGQYADRLVPKLLGGRAVSLLGSPDAPHTLTYPGDVARLLVTVARDDRGWGRPWHVPSGPALTPRAVVQRMCELAGVAPVTVRAVPPLVLTLGGLVVPMFRELKEVAYQHERPFVMDSSAAQHAFGLAPTPLDEVLLATIAAHRPGPSGSVPPGDARSTTAP